MERYGLHKVFTTKRKRKLLLNSREINKLKNASQKKGMTIIPLKLFFNEK